MASKEQKQQLLDKFNTQSYSTLNEYYNSLDLLYWELDLLNKYLHMYYTKKNENMNNDDRKYNIQEIRERIPAVYDSINYYKECINAEKQEMDRINKTYDDEYRLYYGEYDNNGTNTLEKITKYKYNFITEFYEEDNS